MRLLVCADIYLVGHLTRDKFENVDIGCTRKTIALLEENSLKHAKAFNGILVKAKPRGFNANFDRPCLRMYVPR